MRRFLITAPKAFSGEAEAVYDEHGRLVRFDVMATDMPLELVARFKEKITVHVDNLPLAFNGHVTIVEASFEVTFDMFWKAYDKKINRKRCEPLWAKLSEADRVKAHHGVKEYEKYLKKDSWRTKADPEKYLKDRYWENEWK